MVHLEKNKIVIEVEVQRPAQDLVALNTSLLSILACLDSDLAVYEDIQNVLLLSKAMQPEIDANSHEK